MTRVGRWRVPFSFAAIRWYRILYQNTVRPPTPCTRLYRPLFSALSQWWSKFITSRLPLVSLPHDSHVHRSLLRNKSFDMAPNVGLGTQGDVQRGWGLWLTSVLAVIIAGLFVAARIAQRWIKRSGLGMDDYMILAALFSSVFLTLTECQGKSSPGMNIWRPDRIHSCRLWLR
jgi:hypothetical protein